MHRTNFLNEVLSWIEQRQFIDWSIEALEVAGHPLAADIRARFAQLVPHVPDLSQVCMAHEQSVKPTQAATLIVLPDRPANPNPPHGT